MLKKLTLLVKRFFAKFKRKKNFSKRKCEVCSKKFYAHNNDVKRGWGKFCSKDCANKAQSKNFGKENAKRYLDKDQNIWMKYWRDANTGEKKIQIESRFIWEKYNGEIPNGMCISFKDRDNTNTSIENLELVSRDTLNERKIKNYKTIDGIEHKLCGKCAKWLTTENYNRHYKYRYYSYCKDCQKIIRMELKDKK